MLLAQDSPVTVTCGKLERQQQQTNPWIMDGKTHSAPVTCIKWDLKEMRRGLGSWGVRVLDPGHRREPVRSTGHGTSASDDSDQVSCRNLGSPTTTTPNQALRPRAAAARNFRNALHQLLSQCCNTSKLR